MTVRPHVSPASTGSGAERPGLSSRGTKARVAVGVFDTREQLMDAMERLCGYAFSMSQIGILAGRSTVESIKMSAPTSVPAWQPIGRLLSMAEAVTVGSHTWDGIVASRGIGQDAARRLAQISVERVWHGDGSWSGTTRELEEHLRDGAIVLVVAATAPDQQSLSTQILLESSRYPIETIGLSGPLPT